MRTVYVFVEDASVKTFSIGIRSKLFGIFETKWVSYQSRFNSCGPEQASCQPARYCVTVYKRGSLYQEKSERDRESIFVLCTPARNI